jgi:hypothetical protein
MFLKAFEELYRNLSKKTTNLFVETEPCPEDSRILVNAVFPLALGTGDPLVDLWLNIFCIAQMFLFFNG